MPKKTTHSGQETAFKHLSDYLAHNAQIRGSKIALVDADQRYSWQELWQMVEPLSLSLAKYLGSEQQIVGLLTPNSWQYVVSCLAIWQAGHVVLPIDVIYKPLEIDAIIDQLSPALVITDKLNIDRIESKTSPKALFEELKNLPAKFEPKILRQPIERQLASLLFTSGTTGSPKVVPHSHFHHLWNVKVCSDVWQWTADDSLLLSLRLSHWYGLVMGMVGALYHGSTLYLHDHFEPHYTLQTLSSQPITLFTHTPAAYARMLEVANDGSYNLSSVRLFISGSAPLPPQVWQQFKQRFDHEILEVYGTSETGRIASNLLDDRLPASPGKPLPGVKIKFGEHSELLVRSPGVISDYYKNPAATNAAKTSDDWWHTGDIAELKDGRLKLKGRLHEHIRKSGYSLSPRDIEWALLQNSGIKEAHVMGIQKSSNGDDQLVYYLVTKASAKEVEKYYRQNLPSVWRPDKVIILDKLPRNRSGKVDIVELQQSLRSRSSP